MLASLKNRYSLISIKAFIAVISPGGLMPASAFDLLITTPRRRQLSPFKGWTSDSQKLTGNKQQRQDSHPGLPGFRAEL